MAATRDEELNWLLEECRRQQRPRRAPQPIAEVMSRLLSRRGYARVQESAELDGAVRAAVGQRMAKHCRVGQHKRGVLSVTVRNSAVLQELTFQKRRLLQQIQAALPQYTIQEIRLRVGEID